MNPLTTLGKNIVVYAIISITVTIGAKLVLSSYLSFSYNDLSKQIDKTNRLMELFCKASQKDEPQPPKYLEINTGSPCNH